MTRLVSVVLTLAVPEEADPEDAAALAADAVTDLALDVVAAAGVEGHLPLPGSLVQHRPGDGRPWRVETLTPAGALLADLAGTRIHASLTVLGPDRIGVVPPADRARPHPASPSPRGQWRREVSSGQVGGGGGSEGSAPAVAAGGVRPAYVPPPGRTRPGRAHGPGGVDE